MENLLYTTEKLREQKGTPKWRLDIHLLVKTVAGGKSIQSDQPPFTFVFLLCCTNIIQQLEYYKNGVPPNVRRSLEQCISARVLREQHTVGCLCFSEVTASLVTRISNSSEDSVTSDNWRFDTPRKWESHQLDCCPILMLIGSSWNYYLQKTQVVDPKLLLTRTP